VFVLGLVAVAFVATLLLPDTKLRKTFDEVALPARAR